MAVETLYATSHLAGDFTSPTNANGDTPTTWAGQLNTNTSQTSRWAIGNPVDPLTAAATQTVTVSAKKGSNSGNPTIALDLYENGTLHSTILAAADVTSTTGQVLTGTFNTSAITNRNNVEIEVVMTAASGSPSARNSAQVSYIKWAADTSASSSTNYVETGRQFAVTSTVTEAVNSLGMGELGRSVVVASTISSADAGGMGELALPASVTSTVMNVTNGAGRKELGRNLTVTSTISGSDSVSGGSTFYNETGRSLSITATVTGSGLLSMVDDTTFSVVSSLSVAETLGMVEAVGVDLVCTTSGSEGLSMFEVPLFEVSSAVSMPTNSWGVVDESQFDVVGFVSGFDDLPPPPGEPVDNELAFNAWGRFFETVDHEDDSPPARDRPRMRSS